MTDGPLSATTEEAPPPEPAAPCAKRDARRKFLKDVGGIVLGVLIALGIGEAAEAVRTQVRLDQTRDRIDAELRAALAVYEERVLFQPCLDARVTTLRTILDEARTTRRLPEIGEIGRSSVRPITRSAWDVALNSGTTLNMPVGDQTELGLLYGVPDLTLEEMDLWARLRVLEGAAGPISDDLLASMLETVEVLRDTSELNGLAARQLGGAIKARRLNADLSLVGEPGEGLAELRARVAKTPICRPLMVDGRAWTAAAA